MRRVWHSGPTATSTSRIRRESRYGDTTERRAPSSTFSSRPALVASTEAEGLTFGPDGNLYVSDFTNNGVYRYNGSTGAFIDEFVTAGDPNLDDPEDLVFGPDGNSDGELDLYVANDGDHNVVRYQGPSGASPGAFIDEFVAASAGTNARRASDSAPTATSMCQAGATTPSSVTTGRREPISTTT